MWQHEIDRESAMSIGIGLVLGGLVLVVLSYFPGEPFDYTIKEENDLSTLDNCDTTELELFPLDSTKTTTSVEQKEAEVEKAARMLRVDKLQQMLGIEESEIQNMIKKAKQDTLEGKVPSKPINYMAWIDRGVYLTFFILLCYFAQRDYNINVFDTFAYVFPTETNTLRQIYSF